MKRRLYEHTFLAAPLLPVTTPPYRLILLLPLDPPRPPLAALAASLCLFSSFLAASSSIRLPTTKLSIALAIDILCWVGLGTRFLAHFLQIYAASISEIYALVSAASQ